MIKHNTNCKLALIGDSLSGGGAEKVHALLSIYFNQAGCEVHNIIFCDAITYDFAGQLLNLGTIAPKANFITRKCKRFQQLKTYFVQQEFDAVLDFRMRTVFPLEWLLSKSVFPKETFYTVHSGILNYYFPKSPFLSKLLYKDHHIVAVSKAIQQAVVTQGLVANSLQVYNPIDLKTIGLLKQEQCEQDAFIMGIGRMNDEVKQFDVLIKAYANSVLPSKKIKLLLVGEGKHQAKYKALAEAVGVKEQVLFKGFVANPFPYYKMALFTVLTSKNEGFPNVIIESLAVGTPVVSFDCFSGPNEVIRHESNGLLVEDQNQAQLVNAMNLFAENEALYNECKRNAMDSVAPFDIEIIGKQWLQILKNTVS